MKQYKKYEDVPKKYRFDLESLLEGKSIEELIEELFIKLEENLKIKDSKYDDKNSYLDYLHKQEEITILSNKIHNYISNNISVNVVSDKFNKLNEELEFKFFEYSKKIGSETNRIFKNEKKLKEWINLDEFKKFKKDIEFVLKQKKYKFDDSIEEFIKKISRADINAYEIFEIITNSEMDYKYAVSSKRKKIKINPANRMKLMMDKDEMIRKTTYENWAGAYIKHKNSLTSLLYQHIKSLSTWSLERKYNSTIESIISNDNVDVKLLNTIYKNVKSNIHLFKRYIKLHKKFFFAKYKKTFKPWDSQLPLVNVKENYSIEETQEIVYNSLKPMGTEYLQTLKKIFNERWVDYCVVNNKRSGAYSIGGSYGLEKKYILMNHDGKYHSISTLAHEVGHSMHSWYSDNNLNYNQATYPIFLAEIASIFNELMLNDYMIKNSENDKTKFNIIAKSIEEFDATVRKQTMWSEYEFEIYGMIDKGVPLSTFDQIKEVYKNVIKQYSSNNKNNFGKDIDLYGAIMVPHYYYEFYVYKYAIGYLVANYFFQQYKSTGVIAIENYIENFLKQGGSKWPIDLLKEAGINLYDDNFYKNAFKELENKIDMFEKLGNKIFFQNKK